MVPAGPSAFGSGLLSGGWRGLLCPCLLLCAAKRSWQCLWVQGPSPVWRHPGVLGGAAQPFVAA